MAGAKETPRQKMIGMMYLVLTALLALNVSRTILEKFYFINEVLETSVNENEMNNASLVADIKREADESKRADSQKAYEKAMKVRNETEDLLQYMRNLKEEVIKVSGGVNEEGHPVGLDNEVDVTNLLIGARKDGKAYELEKKLNSYISSLKNTVLDEDTKKKLKEIALAAKDVEFFAKDEEQKNKDFATLNFYESPMAASLATLTQIESEVINREKIALEAIAREADINIVKFDKIFPMVSAESNVVAAGTKYKAEMFIAASSSGIKPKMYLGENEIPIDPISGRGQIEFTASAGNYDKEGIAEKKYVARIELKDTTYLQEISYKVAKPVIQVQSQAVQALYFNCANELNVQVPALGTSYSPAFTGSGAQFINGGGGKVTIIPSSAKGVKINVSSGGTFIGSREFRVRRVPKPTIEAKGINPKKGVSRNRLSSVTIAALADEDFQSLLPKEARYRVTKWEATLARGSRAINTVRVGGPTGNLGQLRGQAQKGDNLVIEVKEVKRMNSRGQTENARPANSIIVVPITP